MVSSACGSGPPGSHPSRILAPASLGLRFEEIKIEGEKHRALQSLWSHDSCLDRGEVHLGQAGSAFCPGTGSFRPTPSWLWLSGGRGGGQVELDLKPPPNSMEFRPGAGPTSGLQAWQCGHSHVLAPVASAVRLYQLPPGRACGLGGHPGL